MMELEKTYWEEKLKDAKQQLNYAIAEEDIDKAITLIDISETVIALIEQNSRIEQANNSRISFHTSYDKNHEIGVKMKEIELLTTAYTENRLNNVV